MKTFDRYVLNKTLWPLATAVGVALVALLAIQFRGAPPVAEMAEPIRESLAAGIRFLRGQQVLLGGMSLDLFSVLFGGAVALLPIFAAEILHVGAWGLGV